MQALYTAFIDRVISKYEGGYGWDKKDPGGPTKYGITCYDLAEHRGQKMSSMSAWVEPVKNMTLAEAEAIYATKYAQGVMFNSLNAGVDCVMLDYGINSGVARPVAVARKLVGVAGGSKMDAALLLAVNKRDPVTFINAMCDERLRFMHAIRGGSAWAQFGKGWGSRVADLRSYATHVVQTPTAPAPVAVDLTKTVTPKATNVGASATLPTTIGAPSSGLALHLAGFHWEYAIGGLVLAAAAGVLYEAYHEIKANQANALVHV